MSPARDHVHLTRRIPIAIRRRTDPCLSIFPGANTAGLNALKQKTGGAGLLTRLSGVETACGGVFSVEHEVLADAENRLTLSDNKDVLGLNKPAIRYDVGDYAAQEATDLHTFPITEKLANALGAEKVTRVPGFFPSPHIMGGTIMGNDANTSVVDPDCRAHDHSNPVLARRRGDAFGSRRQQYSDDGGAGDQGGRCHRRTDQAGADPWGQRGWHSPAWV